MAKRISNRDLFGKDLFKPQKQNAEQLKLSIEGLKTSFTELKNELKALKFDSIKDIEKLSSGTNKAGRSFKAFTSAQKELERVEKERLKLQQRLKTANSDRIQQNAELKVLLQEQNKINKQLARETLGLVGAYERQSKRLNQLRKQYKDVALTQGESSKEARRLLKEVTELDKRLKRVDASAGQFQRNVGNYPKFLGSATRALTSFLGAFGLTAGLTGFVRLIQGTIKTFGDFEQASTRVASILNATDQEAQQLQDTAKELGAITARSATEVVALQEAYARLGFTTSEIVDLQKATIDGSVALNAELDETANLTGAIVNTFDDFSTADAPEILDQLTASTQRSALNFEKLNTALPIVAGASNTAGISFTRLLALLGKLSDSGIDASSSATALRNIFIESAKQGLSYEQILDKIANSQDQLTASTDEFGKRASVSGTILAKNIASTIELEKELVKAGGTAERTANEQLDTLQGSVTLLSSAWEGFILSLEDGTGSFAKLLRTIVDVTAEILTFLSGTKEADRELSSIAKTIVNLGKFVGVLVTAWASYRATIIATNIVTKTATLLQGNLTKAIRLSTIAQRALNLVMKANPIALVVTVLTTAVTALRIFSKETETATTENELFLASEEDLNEALKETNQQLENRAKILTRSTDETDLSSLSIAELRDRLREAQSEFDNLNETFAEEERIKAQQRNFQGLSLSARDVQLSLLAEGQAFEFLQGTIEDEIDIIERLLAQKGKEGDATKELTGLIEKQREVVKNLNEELAKADTEELIIAKKEELRLAEIELKRLLALNNLKLENIKINSRQAESIDDVSDAHERELTAIEKKQKALDDELLKKREINFTAKESIEAEEEANKQRIENATETAEEIERIFSEAFRDAFKERFDALDQEEELTRQRLEQQQALAEQGLANQAEFERKKLAEVQAERRQLQKQQQIAEEAEALALAYLNFASERAKEDPNTAPQKALQDVATVAVIKEGAKGLARLAVGSAYDGTEDTGTISGGGIDGKGGRLWVLHDNEGVVTKDANQKYGGLVGAMNQGDVSGWLMKNMVSNPNITVKESEQYTQLEKGFNQLSNEMKAVKNAVVNQEKQVVDVDKIGNMIDIRIKGAVKTATKFQKVRKKI